MFIFSLFLLTLLLFFPSIAITGSRYGATLWLTELLPTLLPFFIAIRLFQYCLPKAAGKRIFLMTGLLCGYPAGASLVTYQYSRNLLSKEAAYFYLGFVNNPSPMFILVFCCQNILGMSSLESFYMFGILIFSSFAGSLIFRCIYHISHARETNRNVFPNPHAASSITSEDSFSAVLDSIIVDSFRVMITIGGYVILFSILGQLFHAIFPENSAFSLLGCGMLEISSGASYLKEAVLFPLHKRILMMTILTFGGLSAAFQTSSILIESGLSLIPYLLNKILNSIVACSIIILLSSVF